MEVHFTVEAEGGVTVTLTIHNVGMVSSSAAPMYIDGGATVTLMLEGASGFTSSCDSCAGIQFSGADRAGIGSGNRGPGSNITVSGGTVTTTSDNGPGEARVTGADASGTGGRPKRVGRNPVSDGVECGVSPNRWTPRFNTPQADTFVL